MSGRTRSTSPVGVAHSPVGIDRPWHFVAAVDGSDGSKGAFEALSAFAKRGDKVTVVHVYDPGKEVPRHEMKPAAIEEYYSMRCISRFPTGAWKVVLKDKTAALTTKQALMTFINSRDLSVDMLLVGFVGRKGPKDDPTVLGTNADYSLRAAHMSATVVKSKTFPEKATYVVCVDGSDRAHFGVHTALHLARAEDKILIVHIAEPTGTTGGAKKFETPVIEARYTEFSASHPNTTFTVLPRDTSVSATICKFAEDNDADVIVLGVDGLGAHAHSTTVLGSNSDAVVRKAPCTVVCVQESGAIYHSDDTKSKR